MDTAESVNKQPEVVQPSTPIKPSNNNIAPMNPPKNTSLIISIMAALIIVLGISAYAIYAFLSTEIVIKSGNDDFVISTPSPKVSDTEEPGSNILAGLTNVEYQNPKEEKLDIFSRATEEVGLDSENTKYYQIGVSGNWKIYAVEVMFSGPQFYTYSDYYLTDGIKKVYVLESNTDEWTSTAIKNSLSEDVEVIKSLKGLHTFPSKFTYKTQDFESPTPLLNIAKLSSENKLPSKLGDESGMDLFVAYQNIKGRIEELKEGAVHDIVSPILKGFYSRQIYLSHPITKLGKYYNPYFKFISDDKKIIAKWNDGRSKDDIYSANSDVCGGYAFGLNVVKSSEIDDEDIKVVGKTNENEPLYQINTKDSDLMKNMYYEEYSVGRSIEDENYPLISFDDFINQPTHFLYKDALGDYIVFMNEKFAGLAECGKPVIYLYPDKTTEVTVKVDAEITKSDPIYTDGWNAIAEPNGSLKVDGKDYDYLYWDGFGNGPYPSLNGYGYITETSKAEFMIRDHLNQLGLNSNEIQDFVDFWIPLLPSTKYVRITWIGTQDMNKLAELTVNPKPDTMIRVFMDYEGLNQTVDLKPQNLIKLDRKGFTLIEWGGLLRR